MDKIKLVFTSPMQLFFFVCISFVAAICFVGMFFNPFQALFFVMAIILARVIYAEKRW